MVKEIEKRDWEYLNLKGKESLSTRWEDENELQQ